MKKITMCIFTLTLTLTVFCFTGCSKKEATTNEQKQAVAKAEQAVHYKDGTFHAFTGIKDDWGGNAEVTITVVNGKITTCEFLSYDKDGKLKDEDYGKTNGVIKNVGLYKIAQAALEGAAQYGQKLIQTQQLDMVDAIAGATVSHELFQNAAGIALRQAKAAH